MESFVKKKEADEMSFVMFSPDLCIITMSSLPLPTENQLYFNDCAKWNKIIM